MPGPSALLIIDVQNDFCPGGALPVPEGDRIVRPLNRYVEEFVRRGRPVLLSRDWHPPGSRHFRPFGGAWPVHCLRGTWGAEFHPDLDVRGGMIVVSKGTTTQEEGYSAFGGRTDDGRTLDEVLKGCGVRRIFVGGLATDYCVRATCLDGLKSGYETVVLGDAVRGVDRTSGDVEAALAEIEEHGGRVLVEAAVRRLLDEEET